MTNLLLYSRGLIIELNRPFAISPKIASHAASEKENQDGGTIYFMNILFTGNNCFLLYIYIFKMLRACGSRSVIWRGHGFRHL